MPELPEVEVICRGLNTTAAGVKIVSVVVSNQSFRAPIPRAALRRHLPGAVLGEFQRRGKYLFSILDNGATFLVHLGMSGRLGIFPGGSPKAKHDHLRLALDCGLELRFNDPRRFGLIALLPPGRDVRVEYFGALGPEPLERDFSAEYLGQRARGRTQPVKNFLMDSRTVVGIGNIYASETLFRAGIHPETPAGSLGIADFRRIVRTAREVLTRAIAAGGTTISDFLGASGEKGLFQLELQVYGREGQACPRCKKPVRRAVLGGRSTFFCPRCQKLHGRR